VVILVLKIVVSMYSLIHFLEVPKSHSAAEPSMPSAEAQPSTLSSALQPPPLQQTLPLAFTPTEAMPGIPYVRPGIEKDFDAQFPHDLE
jgi:hypothetical protein